MRSVASLLAPTLMPSTPSRSAGDAGERGVETAVVEAHAVDDRAVLLQPEQARARVAGLGLRRKRADLDAAEAERVEAGDGARRPCRRRRPGRPGWGRSDPRRWWSGGDRRPGLCPPAAPRSRADRSSGRARVPHPARTAGGDTRPSARGMPAACAGVKAMADGFVMKATLRLYWRGRSRAAGGTL